MEIYSLYDLLVKKEIKGLIFDKYNQKHHFRLFPFKQNLFGSFEAFIYDTIDIRYRSKKLEQLVLSNQDKQVILFAFLHRESLGIADGMGDISNPNFDVARFSPGSKEDNYIFSANALLDLYNKLTSLKEVKLPLPKDLVKVLSLPMSHCYFDKAPLLGTGSICTACAEELRSEGYEISDDLITDIAME